MLLGVYGSLRKGQFNYNYLLSKKKFIGTTIIKGLLMYSLGPYPCIVNTNNDKHKVVMEIYELDDIEDKKTIGYITNMEIGAGYIIKTINTKLGNVLYYAYKNPPEYGKIIESGDWVDYIESKVEKPKLE